MISFSDHCKNFELQFNKRHFPDSPENLYNAAQYILSIGGKRVRPVSVLMGNDLFEEVNEDAYHVANAVELFHNFSLIHDDIMDKAPLRRGVETVHKKFGDSTALLAGDVMLVAAYENLNMVKGGYIHQLLSIFNTTSKEVCEGQQMDIDFEKLSNVTQEQYVEMITRKTSVLLASSLKMGSIIGGAGLGNQEHIYNFGKYLGIAFQVQDDYLDAFGDPVKFGKQVGGDIIANKKTFLLIHALQTLSNEDRHELEFQLSTESPGKVEKVINLFRKCNADQWAISLKEKYFEMALGHLESIAVLSSRKKELETMAKSLMQREN